jgi:hypothetical protein
MKAASRRALEALRAEMSKPTPPDGRSPEEARKLVAHCNRLLGNTTRPALKRGR